MSEAGTSIVWAHTPCVNWTSTLSTPDRSISPPVYGSWLISTVAATGLSAAASRVMVTVPTLPSETKKLSALKAMLAAGKRERESEVEHRGEAPGGRQRG